MQRSLPVDRSFGLSPKELNALTDALTADLQSFWTLTGIDPASPATTSTPATNYWWLLMLDRARELECMQAVKPTDYLRAAIYPSVAVLGFGIAFTAPEIDSVPAKVGIFIAAASGGATLWDSSRLIRKDLRVTARLHAIDRAKLLLNSIA